MTNNECRIPEDLKGYDRDLFAHYMLGAASAHIPEETWQRLCNDAYQYCLNMRKIREEPVTRS